MVPSDISFGAEMPPFEELGPLIDSMLTDSAAQQSKGLDGLRQFLAGDMLSTQHWPRLREALIHLLNGGDNGDDGVTNQSRRQGDHHNDAADDDAADESNESESRVARRLVAERALQLVAELFDAAVPSPQTGDIFTLLAEHLLRLRVHATALPSDLRALFRATATTAAAAGDAGVAVAPGAGLVSAAPASAPAPAPADSAASARPAACADAVWALRRVALLHGMMQRLPLFWLHFTDALARSVFAITTRLLLVPLEPLCVAIVALFSKHMCFIHTDFYFIFADLAHPSQTQCIIVAVNGSANRFLVCSASRYQLVVIAVAIFSLVPRRWRWFQLRPRARLARPVGAVDAAMAARRTLARLLLCGGRAHRFAAAAGAGVRRAARRRAGVDRV
jgi:hypothetical protein